MSSRPLAILSAPGSRGDVNPMVAIGKALKSRGYDVAISLAEPYAAAAESAGLEPHSLIDQKAFDEVLSDPNVWKLIRGMRKVVRGIAADYLQPHFDLIRKLHRPGRTVLVSHPLDFASRVHRAIDPSTPLVDVHLAPVMLRTRQDPAHLTPWRFEPTRHPLTFRMSYWMGDAMILDRILGPSINRVLAEHGREKVRRVMNRWWLSPDRVLLMYPDWFAPATKGFLPQIRHVGFPLDDGAGNSFAPPTDSPIVFTGGTANVHTRKFFERAADACKTLGRSGILLSSHAECVPDSLPTGVRAVGYVPLGRLLPHCSAIVHHGGIGTTSQSLRAGKVQVVRPMAFDQFDNANRVCRLGCGVHLKRDGDLIRSLRRVLGSTDMSEAAGAIAERLVGDVAVESVAESAAERAADQVDAVMAGRTVKV